MKVLYVTDSYPPVVNGVSVVVDHLARGMAEKGHSVEVATIDETGALPKKEVISGVTVERFLGFRPGRSYHIPTPEMLRVLGESYDVIHVHNFHSVLPLVFSTRLLSRGEKRLHVLTPHFHVPGHHLNTKVAWLFYRQMLRSRIRRYDVVQCVSRFESERVYQFFGTRPLVVENGVDKDVYNYKWNADSDGRIDIVFVGRLERYKRADLVLQAAHLLNGAGFTTSIKVVGSGPEEATLARLSKQLGVGLEVRNRVSRKELLELISRSTCLVNPSRYEAYSLVAAEALAMGVPVVVTWPWGVNFQQYPRAKIVNSDTDSIAEGILRARSAGNEAVKAVPTWGEVVDQMCECVYSVKPA